MQCLTCTTYWLRWSSENYSLHHLNKLQVIVHLTSSCGQIYNAIRSHHIKKAQPMLWKWATTGVFKRKKSLARGACARPFISTVWAARLRRSHSSLQQSALPLLQVCPLTLKRRYILITQKLSWPVKNKIIMRIYDWWGSVQYCT